MVLVGVRGAMDDREGLERLRRHHRRLLPWEGGMPQEGATMQIVERGEDEDSGEVGDLAKRTCCENITFMEGRRKYVCASLANHSYDGPLLQTNSFSDFGLLRAGKRQGPSMLGNLLKVFGDDHHHGGRVNNRRNVSGGAGALIVGGVVVAAKVVALLLSRSLCGGAWPIMQVLSICTLPFGPLKQLVRMQPRIQPPTKSAISKKFMSQECSEWFRL